MDRNAAELLCLLRESKGVSRLRFATMTNWSYDTQRRLEEGKTPFRFHHLEALVNAGWVSRGSKLYVEFQRGMLCQALRGGNEDLLELLMPVDTGQLS